MRVIFDRRIFHNLDFYYYKSKNSFLVIFLKSLDIFMLFLSQFWTVIRGFGRIQKSKVVDQVGPGPNANDDRTNTRIYFTLTLRTDA